MPVLKVSGKDSQGKTNYVYGFQKGVNVLQDNSLIDDHELAYSQNAVLVVDGIKKRGGTANFGSSSGSRVFGASAFYTSATSNNRWIIREGGTALQYYNGSNVPTNISGATMTTGKRTEFAMARDTLYVQNGVDPLVKIQITGGVPAATVFTALTTPTGLTVTQNGTVGSTTYSYRVSAYNAVGETLACTSVAIANGNATLSSTNNISLSWTAVASAVGYVIYGRKPSSINGLGETHMTTVSTNSFTDDGTFTPSTVLLAPEGNSTGGVKGSMIIYAMSRLFAAGDTNNPSRMYYSGGATQIDDFSTAFNGGFVDVAKNDGDSITGLAFYQNHIIVFKNRSVWQFDITSTGLPQLTLITAEVGCCSHRTIRNVNNDLWFLAVVNGRPKIFSLGNVQNYFSALRTTQQSLKIEGDSWLNAANITYIANSCAAYFRNLYIVCVPDSGSTTNNKCYVFDTRFGSWVGFWDSIPANAFFTYTDASNQEELYYASETSGYVVKMFTGTADNGAAVKFKIQTKNFMQQFFDQYKIFRNPIFWFKEISGGTITGSILTDGVFTSGTFNISPIVSGVGWGFDKWGAFKWGTSAGAAGTTTTSDQPMEVIQTLNSRSIQFELDDSNASASFKFLGLSYRWILLEGKVLPATNRIRLT